MVKIKIVNRGRQQLPAYATELSAGMDLRANIDESITLNPMERRIIPTGLYMALPPGYEAQVRPRSGLAFKHGITVLNSPGTIDADYRGDETCNRHERILFGRLFLRFRRLYVRIGVDNILYLIVT